MGLEVSDVSTRRLCEQTMILGRKVKRRVVLISSSTGLFTHYCYANEVGRHTKPSKFWSDDGIQRTA